MATDQGEQTGGIPPGLYEMLYRQLTFRECWRLGGGFPLGLPLLLAKRMGWREPLVWVPSLKRPCSGWELSPECRERLLQRVAKLRTLGFARGTGIAPSPMDPRRRGAFIALHNDRMRYMWLGCSSNPHTKPMVWVDAAAGLMF